MIKKNKIWVLFDTHKAKKKGMEAIKERQRERLSEMIDFARRNSPYYRELYKNLPEKVDDITMLPVTSKKELMEHFNEWVTDRDITFEGVHSFTRNPSKIGEKYKGKYMVATTSGTTGNHGIFLKDDYDITVNLALNLKNTSKWLGAGGLMKYLARGGRMAGVVATGGHFLAISGLEFMKKSSKLFSPDIKAFSVHTPIHELVSKLNQYNPAILTGYGTVISMLADEQAAGRLNISPILILPAGEAVTKEEYKRISEIFNAKVHDFYGCTECPYLSSDCEYGWYHINSDWVIVEPVDENYQPVKPGEQSHTVLITNLANHVQPIIRYDLGDSIIMRQDSCPCGNPHPAIRVQGRAADMLKFSAENGEKVSILPLMLVSLVDSVPGIKMYQLVQTSPTSLRVRLISEAETDSGYVWQMVHTKLIRLFNEHNLKHVTIERGEEPPEQSSGGKYRTIIPFKG